MTRLLTLLILLATYQTSHAQTVESAPPRAFFSLNAGGMAFTGKNVLHNTGLKNLVNPVFKGTFNFYISTNWGFGMELQGSPLQFSNDGLLSFLRRQNIPSDFVMLYPESLQRNGHYLGFSTGPSYRIVIGKLRILTSVNVGLMTLNTAVPDYIIYKKQNTNYLFSQQLYGLNDIMMPTLSPQASLQYMLDESWGLNFTIGSNISLSNITYSSHLTNRLNYESSVKTEVLSAIQPSIYVSAGVTFNKKQKTKKPVRIKHHRISPVEKLW